MSQSRTPDQRRVERAAAAICFVCDMLGVVAVLVLVPGWRGIVCYLIGGVVWTFTRSLKQEAMRP